MPQEYLDFLARREQEDQWSFFDLAGCPRELVVYLYELADLANQKEIGSSMKWLSFNMAPVFEVENKIAGWVNNLATPSSHDEEHEEPISDEQAEWEFHISQDRYHCTEAWRHALLLYIERVFKCNGHRKRRPRKISRLTRLTLDHVRCGRQTSQTQKQLLLPVFLAGSETGDGAMREFVKEYCEYWAVKTRYEMFNTVAALLDEIWAAEGWWGTVIDRKTRPAAGTQFLFG